MPTVSAMSWERNCTGSTLYMNYNLDLNQSGNISYFRFNTTVPCPYGCADNSIECAEPAETDSGMLLAIGVILGMVAFIFAYLSRNIQWGGEKYSWPLQVMFLFGCVLFILLDIGIIAGFSTFTQNNISDILNICYMAVVFLMLIMFLIFMVLLVIKAVEYLTSQEDGNSEEKQDHKG